MNGKQKILIVDDRKENLLALRKALRGIDAEFIEASNGNEALAATIHHDFAVALLDVQMPGMSGYELAEHLRGDRKTQVIPIVFLTASYGDDAHMFKGYEAGAVDYIMKPFHPEVLQGKVKALLEIALYRRELEESEKKYRNLIETTRTGFIVLDGQGRVLDANAEYVRLSGHHELAEILGRGVTEWTAAHSLEKNTLALAQCSRAGVIQGLEIDYVGVDGKIITVEINATAEGAGDDLRIVSLCRDITERKRIEELQTFLAQTTTGTREEPFFNTLARYLAQSLCMDFVCIDHLEGDGLTARTVAVWCDGHFEDNVTYALKDTPCGDVVGKTVCCFPANVCQFFPLDQVLRDLRAESYVGVTLFGHAGQPIGLIAVIGRSPMANRHIAESTLKMVAVRVAGELERVGVEEALLASEKRYSTTISAVNDGLWDWHVPSGNAFFSDMFYTLLGYEPGEFPATYNAWRLLVHPEDIDRVEREIQKSVAIGTGFVIDLRMRCKSGEWLWVCIRGKTIELDADGKALRMVGILSDISVRKLAEMMIVEKEEEIHLLLDSTAEAIYGLDMNGNCTFCNSACLRLLGYTHTGELLGKNMHWQIHFKHPDGSVYPLEDCRIFQAFEKGESVHVDDEVFWRADGTSFPTECRSFPQRKDGVLVGSVVTFLDITERKRMEAEKVKLEEQNRQLQKAESLGRMSGSIAHIFNNQLQVVTGYLEMVIGKLPPNDSRALKLAMAMQAAKKASEVSGNLLAYLGQKQVKLELLDLAEICRMSLPALQRDKPENVTLENDLPSPGPCISADAKQIQQILTNLVINAWEAIADEAGTVTLAVKTVSAADIPESHRFPLEWQSRKQRYACLEIRDSGCGVEEKDIDKLFDPFFSTKFTGRGLGLSIALGIVTAHAAVITVETKVNGGSVFSVFLPLSEQVMPPKSEQLVKPVNIDEVYTILLVEDEAPLREMFKIALTNMKFKVFQARDGVEALEIFRKHKDEISCLLSDLTMPRMGGWETIAAVRAIRHDLPVILASGYDEARAMAGKHAEMPDFFLNKPYDLYELGDTIRNVIARKTVSGGR